MIRYMRGAEVLFARYPTALSKPNVMLLIPWRLAALMLHICALITVADYRHVLIVKASLPPRYSQADYDLLQNSTNWAIAASAFCLLLVSHGFFSGRTTQCEALNLIHAACHTTAGVLLISVWNDEAHVARLWHVWYFFSLIPAAIETLATLLSMRQGMPIC